MTFWPIPSARVLVVSSESFVRQGLARMLSGSGYACDTAEDGDHAFERVAKLRPLVAVVDMRASDEEYLFFVALLRKRFPEIGVVRLLDGRALIDSGKTGHIMDFDTDTALPTIDLLQRAIEWVLAERSLRTFVPPRLGRA